MRTEAANSALSLGRLDQLQLGRQILHHESEALSSLAERLDGEFCRAVQRLLDCRGSVIVSGMGKAGLVGQKITATLASTGTRAHFLHPAEAIHGDLGRIDGDDAVLMLSQSGETEEVLRILPSLAAVGVPVIAITAQPTSSLGRAAEIVLALGDLQEACTLGLAPSTSTTAMMALGDSLALVVSRMRGFGPEDFARFHPGGSLGRKLSRVEEAMRPLGECRIARESMTVRQVFVALSRPGRRTGAVMLVDAQGRLSGIFTDSDLARLFESNGDGPLDRPVREVMTASPATVEQGTRLPMAVEILKQKKISELPVVDEENRPVGLLDITDVVGLLPADEPAGGPEHPRQTTQSNEPAEPLLPATVPFANHQEG
jgi:arabinose-5-phosphate isomerase